MSREVRKEKGIDGELSDARIGGYLVVIGLAVHLHTREIIINAALLNNKLLLPVQKTDNLTLQTREQTRATSSLITSTVRFLTSEQNQQNSSSRG